MADEITISAQIGVEKGNSKLDRYVNSFTADWTGTKWSYEIQTIGSGSGGNHESLNIGGDVLEPGYAWFRNGSSTATVQVGTVHGADEFEPFLSLRPGSISLVELATVDLYAQAIGDEVDLEFWILEN